MCGLRNEALKRRQSRAEQDRGTHLSVHGDALEVEVCLSEHCACGCLVHPSGLDAHEAVLHDVDSAHTVGASHLIMMRDEQHSGRGRGGSRWRGMDIIGDTHTTTRLMGPRVPQMSSICNSVTFTETVETSAHKKQKPERKPNTDQSVRSNKK
jgi:hypothetical protein